MTNKVDIKRLDSITKNDTTATEQINDNFKALQEAIENTLSRDGTGPNFMDANLDMNSYRIINSAYPAEDNDIVNLKYVEERIGGAVEAAKTATSAATQAANSAQSALVSSTNAINTLRNAEEQLNNVVQYVDEAKQTIDETIDAAVEDVKKQALDAAQESIDTAAMQATEIVIDYANNELKPLLNEIAANAESDAENAAESAEIASNESDEAKHWAEDARIWAEGEQAEVQELGGELSSMGAADLAYAIANAPEDTPINASGLFAMNVVKGPKGDKGDQGEKGEDGKDGGGLEIGDIGIAPLGIDETQNKRRYLNGQVISQSQFESFTKKIKEAIAVNSNLATSETNWQAEVTNSVNGTCGKFVIDDEAGTIRLPKYPEYVSKEYVEAAVVGNGMTLGLTDGTSDYGALYLGNGTYRGLNMSKSNVGVSVATSGATGTDWPVDRASLGVTTDPTKSGIVADLKNATTETIPCKWFIQVSTGVEETVDVTREIELNNPFSLLDYKWSEYELNNASWLLSNGAFHSGVTYVAVYELLLKIYNGTETKDGVSVKLSTEAYTDTDFVLNTADTTFRLPIKVKLASGNAVVGNGLSLGLITKDGEFYASYRTQDGDFHVAGSTNNTIGSGYTHNGFNGGWGITTDPAKSNIETSSSGLKLYFYVGETVQDANIINASGVLTRVAELSDEHITGLGMPDYSAGVSVEHDLATAYACPYRGYYYVKISKVKANVSVSLYINGIEVNDTNYSNTYDDGNALFLCDAGDVITADAGNTRKVVSYIPLKGAK